MIAYTEKGSGLHERIRAAGHSLAQVDGVWVADDAAAVQALIDAYTPADAAAYLCTAISAHAKALRDRVVAAISPGEMASWAIKRAEMLAYAASGNAADAPLLAAEATARGCPLVEIVSRVQGSAAAFAALEAAISGAAGRHRDTVKALATHAEIAAYDWSAGWPPIS